MASGIGGVREEPHCSTEGLQERSGWDSAGPEMNLGWLGQDLTEQGGWSLCLCLTLPLGPWRQRPGRGMRPRFPHAMRAPDSSGLSGHLWKSLPAVEAGHVQPAALRPSGTETACAPVVASVLGHGQAITQGRRPV